MTARLTLALLIAGSAATAAAAQEAIHYTFNWHEVNAGTSAPVAIPNGVIDPGEGARLRLTAEVIPGIGSPVTYQTPPAPGFGTIAALFTIYFDLFGTGADGGSWSTFRRNPFGEFWGHGNPGLPQPNGDILAAQAGQIVLPGGEAYSTNPVINIWAATWTPSSYTPRSACFQSAAAGAAGPNHSAILIDYILDPKPNGPLYVGRYIDGVFGNTGPIPIIPSPAGLALLGLAALAAPPRRTRRHTTSR